MNKPIIIKPENAARINAELKAADQQLFAESRKVKG